MNTKEIKEVVIEAGATSVVYEWTDRNDVYAVSVNGNPYGNSVRVVEGGRESRDSKRCSIIIKPTESKESIVTRVQALLKRGVERVEKLKLADAAHDENLQRQEAQRAEHKNRWVGLLRVAKGGTADTKLEGDSKFTSISEKQLLDCGNSYETSIRVALPTDLEARAAFLAKLDAFLKTAY